MGTSALKSPAITNLDSTPVVPNTSGEGAAGYLEEIHGYVTTVAADGTSSTYQFVRLPSNAKVKHVFFEAADTGGTGTLNIGVWYGSGSGDGTPSALKGTVIDADFFASAVDISGQAVAITDVTNEGGFYTADKRNQPLWQAVGLSADPGGFLDVVGQPAAALTNAGLLGLSVQFVR